LICRAAPSRSPPRHRMPTGCVGWPARPPSTDSRDERRPGSMNGARFVHDQLELAGFKVAIADAQKVKGLAPLAGKTDRIDAWVLPRAVPPRPGPRDLAAHPGVRAERERARFRLHLHRHRTALNNRIHATLLAFAKPCPVSDLLWRRRPAAAGPPDPARAVDRQPHRGPGPHRRPGRPDRRLRTAAAAAGRRSPLCAVVDDRTRDRLGAGLPHRRRGGRQHPVPLAQEAVRL
jgi:hypothetical protein